MRVRIDFLGVVLAAAACAPQYSDYTPQIYVAPGVAERLQWIQSKNLPQTSRPGGEADVDAEAPAEEVADAEAGDDGGRNEGE